MTPFRERVLEIITMVPYGTVASYGQVAAMAGIPRAARQVGWILNASEMDESITIPWWRIVNNAGVISIKGTVINDKLVQAEKIKSEGIPVSENFTVDMARYRFRPTKDQLRSLKLDDYYIELLLEKYAI